MTFLQPALLIALPLAAAPVIIHLIHLFRRRQVKWAAMMFLFTAQQMNKGLSRLRQVLILAFRVLAVAAIVFVIGRPLAGGWLGLTGGAPDTVLILLDRSASMEQMNPVTGLSKRAAGLRNIAKALADTVGTRSHLVLIDSALGKPLAFEKPETLPDLPQTEPTDTASDIPGLLQTAMEYLTANRSGRTDVWLLSDLRQSDWEPSGGRWETLRNAFGLLKGVRFHILAYPQPAPDDLAVTVEHAARREAAGKAELLLDLRIVRQTASVQPVAQPADVPLRFSVNGTVTTAKVTLKDNQAVLQGYSLPIDPALKHGWGYVELPADSCPQNNDSYFVFDQPPVLRSVIVCDDPSQAGPIKAALSAPADSARKYNALVLSASRAAEIPWEDTALIVWQAPIPKPDDPLARQLREHAAGGRSIIFLPAESTGDPRLFGLGWGAWNGAQKPLPVEWWRNDSDLLANARDGSALPVGLLEISRRRRIVGDGVCLARVAGREPLLMRSLERGGGVYFLGTLPGPGESSLARDGLAMFALLHRALNQGAATLGKAQQRTASAVALGASPGQWRRVTGSGGTLRSELPLRAGVVAAGDRLVALNRPPAEDLPLTLSTAAVDELFAGLDHRILTETLESGRNLTNEVWRTFLIAGALALLAEALLCMPQPRIAPTAATSPIRT